MKKILSIFGLILIFWCHQSHHQLFLFMGTSPLGLASEEFIPVVADSDAEELPTPASGSGSGSHQSHEPVVVGSQSDKSDGVTAGGKIKNSPVTAVNPKGESDGNSLKTEEGNSNNKNKIELESLVDVDGDSGSSHNIGELDKSHNVTNEEKSNKVLAEDIKARATIPTSNVDGDIKGHDTTEQVVVDLSQSATVTETSSNVSSTILEEPLDTPSQHSDQDHEEPESQSETKVDTSETLETPSSNAEEEAPIPSFMEWTQIQQQKLHESAQAHGSTNPGQANGHNGHKTQHTANSQQNESAQALFEAVAAKIRKESTAKNFASPDCGAKVIQSNSESQNSNGVLSSTHDEYMLNKCGIPIWFIVELCEPLKIEKVSLGNLELFSSSPKDVEIGISDRYPTRDWTKHGPFTLPDIRAIHSIVFPATNASTFGKFLKVNILSHYGTEHFCPLSLVRVNGISEYEVLESENTHPDSTEKEESALYEEPMTDHPTTGGNVAADKSVFGSAKDAVINIVKKAAQVLGKSDNKKDALQHGRAIDTDSTCRTLLQCLPNYELDLKERVLSLLSCNFSDLLPFLSKNSPWCGWDYCHSSFNKHSIGLPWQPEGFYASMFGGPSVLHALCNYHRPLPKEPCDTLHPLNSSTASSDNGILSKGYINESLKSQPIVGAYPDESEDKTNTMFGKESHADKGKDSGDVGEIPEVSNKDQTLEMVQTPQPPEESATAAVPNINGENQQNTASPPPIIIPVQATGNSEDVNLPPPTQHQTQNNQQQQATGQQQQKESVFVRLSNRIKTLERNQSLTASYLEELSRRFKKQNEENYHLNEGTKRFVNESRVKFKTLEDLYKFELRSLRRNTDEVRERLFNVQLQRSVLILLCLIQLFGLLSVCFWARKRFRQFESELQSMSPQQSSQTFLPISSHTPISTSCRSSPPQSILQRKRINSEASIGSSLSSFDKSKKIKKKKKKLADLKPVNIKSSGPASAPIDYHHQKGAFKFEYPETITSSSVYNINVLSSYKENIKPEPKTASDFVPGENKSVLFGGESNLTRLSNSTGIPILATQVDSPFSMISSTATNFYPDSGVSTSSRFALLASPGPAAIGKQSNLKRSGSLTSLDDRSSLSSYGDKTGLTNVVNGHSDSQSQRSNGSGNGKKRKNKGLKAFMPKIFDR